MKIREQDLTAIAELGYTADEARFLYIVATHSGYFQPRQYVAANALLWGGRVQRLTGKLESRGHATWREYQDIGGVYHLLSKTIYRRIEKTGLRNHRRHSTEYIRTRLLLLDFILENPEHHYFETETDKLAYFCGECGFPAEVLPSKVYSSASGAPPARRYFVDKFPLFLDSSRSSSSPVVSLSYVDPGQASVAGFAHHLRQYRTFLSSVGSFAFVYIAKGSANLRKAERCFDSFVERRLGPEAVKDIVLFFKRRRAWELKRYGQFSNEDLEGLHSAKQRYVSAEIETLYASWYWGELDDGALERTLVRKFSTANVTFRTYLVRRKADAASRNAKRSRGGLDPLAREAASPPTSAPPRLEDTETQREEANPRTGDEGAFGGGSKAVTAPAEAS